MIGTLKHRIRFEEPVDASDGGGGVSRTWQALAQCPDVYAAIEPVSAGDQLRFYQPATNITHRITVRYRDDITTAMRIEKDDRTYTIVSVIDRDGTQTYLEILAAIKTP